MQVFLHFQEAVLDNVLYARAYTSEQQVPATIEQQSNQSSNWGIFVNSHPLIQNILPRGQFLNGFWAYGKIHS
jgi:hypothetical protein